MQGIKTIKHIKNAALLMSLALLILQATIMQANANNHSFMQWTYHQFDDANNGNTTSQFQVGIPQTDNIVASGTCSAGQGGSFSTVLFGANIPAHVVGKSLQIRLNTSSGIKIKHGVAVGADFEEGLSGVEFALNNDDLIWRSLANMNSLTYTVSGQTYTLPLRGSGRTIASFLHDCNFYGTQNNRQPGRQFGTQFNNGNQPTFSNKKHLKRTRDDGSIDIEKDDPVAKDDPVIVNAEEVFDPRWASCDLLQDEVSQKSDFPVTMTIVNKTDSHRAVMWIDFEGDPKEYASLNVGEKYTIKTYISHPWMFTDGPGNCLEMFMPHQGVDTFNITAPNRDFGPE